MKEINFKRKLKQELRVGHLTFILNGMEKLKVVDELNLDKKF
jgi:hypothetical protein